MTALIDWLLGLLEHPVKVAVVALLVGFGGLLIQGTLFDLWNLKNEKHRLEKKYSDTLKSTTSLEFRIEEAKNSDKFIGHQAREKLDLVRDDELVFIFENEGSLQAQDSDSTLVP